MTIEQILDCSASELEKMTDEELLLHFKKYLDVTRPERAAEIRKTQQPKQQSVTPVYISPQKKAALAMMQEAGIDMSFTKKFGRK